MPQSLNDLTTGWNWIEILATVSVVLAAWLAARVFTYLVVKVAARLERDPGKRVQHHILNATRRPVALLIFLVGIYVALHRYKFGLLSFLDNVIFVAGVILIIHTVTKVSIALLRWYGERVTREGGGETFAGGLLPIAEKIGKLIILVIGLIVILDHFDIEIRSILVTLGVGTLALGLALQDTLANMFGGLAIMLDRPFAVGDRIELSAGETGDVQEIGLRSTRVLTPEGSLLVIPNSLLVKAMMTNHSQPDLRARIFIDVGVAYGTDLARAKQVLLETAKTNPRLLRPPEPVAGIRSFADSAVNLRLICFVKDFRERFIATDELHMAIAEGFRAAGVDIPFPIRTVYVRGESDASAPQ